MTQKLQMEKNSDTQKKILGGIKSTMQMKVLKFSNTEKASCHCVNSTYNNLQKGLSISLKDNSQNDTNQNILIFKEDTCCIHYNTCHC